MTPTRSSTDHEEYSRDPDSEATAKGFRLPHSDPTADAAVRNIMAEARADDYAVVDLKGHVLFRIKPDVLAGILHHLHFTTSRRRRDTIRAHKKKAPDAGQGVGSD